MNNQEKQDSLNKLKFEVDLQVKYIIKTVCNGLEVDDVDMQNILNSQFYKDCNNGLVSTAIAYKQREDLIRKAEGE